MIFLYLYTELSFSWRLIESKNGHNHPVNLSSSHRSLSEVFLHPSIRLLFLLSLTLIHQQNPYFCLYKPCFPVSFSGERYVHNYRGKNVFDSQLRAVLLIAILVL